MRVLIKRNGIIENLIEVAGVPEANEIFSPQRGYENLPADDLPGVSVGFIENEDGTYSAPPEGN